MPKWNNIGPIEKYADGNQWLVKIKSRPVALFKHNENYYAIKNSCAHQGYPLRLETKSLYKYVRN